MDMPTIRHHQAAGGTSSICLGGAANPTPQRSVGRQALDGTATLDPGGDYPHDARAANACANKLAHGLDLNCGDTLTERPMARLHQGSGGASIVYLDDGPVRVPVQGASADQSAAGSKQHTGDATTDKPTTRFHQARGGISTTCLGSNYPHDNVEKEL